MPKTMDHTDAGSEASISGIATPPPHGTTQTITATTPVRNVKSPKFLSDDFCISAAPMRNSDIGSNVKKATET